jgi:hypothetical protein
MFSIMPHRDRTAGYARLTQIDPIQVWINAERRLMGLLITARWHAAKSCGTVIPQLSRFNDATMSARHDAQLSIRRLDIARGPQCERAIAEQRLRDQRDHPERGVFPAALRVGEEEPGGTVHGEDRAQQDRDAGQRRIAGPDAEDRAMPLSTSTVITR